MSNQSGTELGGNYQEQKKKCLKEWALSPGTEIIKKINLEYEKCHYSFDFFF